MKKKINLQIFFIVNKLNFKNSYYKMIQMMMKEIVKIALVVKTHVVKSKVTKVIVIYY